MNDKLYLERWLLLLKQEAADAGLEARVRALDRKGGQWLAFAVRQGSEALEIRYYKRLVGPALAAAATGAEIVGRVREVHAQVHRKHRRLLENGLRRFLLRSIALLQALESALLGDRELLKKAEAALQQAPKAPPNLRPAAAARKQRGLRKGFEILPAAGLPFFVIRDSRLVDLSLFVPLSKKQSEEQVQQARHLPWGEWVGEAGVELISAGSGAADAGAAVAETGAAVGAGMLEAAQVAGAAVDVVGQGGSACADASAGIDCGGIDCVPG
ncbi:MAG: hypothetical protein L0Y72_20755 [Gemmataceae bacterium]|nr:hypothetical protein [Gemmataceae bacterium]MCI0741471.1 hypothetical protein [Gemmataceae bacterium]